VCDAGMIHTFFLYLELSFSTRSKAKGSLPYFYTHAQSIYLLIHRSHRTLHSTSPRRNPNPPSTPTPLTHPHNLYTTHHSCTLPSPFPLTLPLAQYAPLTPPKSAPNPNLIGILAPSSGVLGGCTVREPTSRPMSVDTQPGQQQLIVREGWERAREAVRAFRRALERE